MNWLLAGKKYTFPSIDVNAPASFSPVSGIATFTRDIYSYCGVRDDMIFLCGHFGQELP